MGKLRNVYPNVLHLEKPGMLDTKNSQLKQERLKQGELSMFKDFYSQVSGQVMSEEQHKLVAELIDGLAGVSNNESPSNKSTNASNK